MPDPAEQMQRLAEAGFSFETFDRYPQAVGAMRDGCIALLSVSPTGLKLIGLPGWRLGEVMGVLVKKEGRQVFQARSEVLEATPERLEALARFRRDLEQALTPAA